ncbi:MULTISPECIES: alpha/beta hydrolase family protein [unclassified Mesorhizobium]|uniref:alpha/beta hydrolase family protein n=1 Tax=unclassified Mesorhizobium TaxID=325217 RepID=UPI001CCD6CA0|nr:MULTISPECIES: prolyl oligopeptidase family serine peptidase [unclassified Mesorhizobium]MBZ9743281.1 prolyl oligopeptidase family serine peptidase [Mesorhizobium sp. CO1-1-4]MBZ9804855.1 prolyl oligopeptidase family serine peptidase [Mesorhizobium sp. ES1-6]
MKFRTMLCAIIVATIAPQHQASAGDAVGVRHVAAPSLERGGDLDVTVWYPAEPGGVTVNLGDSELFTGTSAARDAPISPGKFPLILLSHGAGLAGTPQAMSWIATPLARQGFIVAAPTHPGNGGKNRSAAETMKLWLRPVDLTATLDAMEKEASFRGHIDQGKVGALGLSMGGGTALAIAGARVDPKRLAAYCDTGLLNASLCGWIRQSGVDLHAMDMRLAGRDNSDRRIRFAMAIDPAPSDVFDAASFSGIRIPVDIVNLGQPGKIPITADASAIAKAISGASYATIADASHYSMFGECKPDAPALVISEEIGDPVCDDGGGRPRGQIHAQLIEMAAAAFNRALKAAP